MYKLNQCILNQSCYFDRINSVITVITMWIRSSWFLKCRSQTFWNLPSVSDFPPGLSAIFPEASVDKPANRDDIEVTAVVKKIMNLGTKG